MDVVGGLAGTDYNTNIQQFSYTGNYNQAYQFFHLGNGVYKIMARHSKMVLTVQKMGTAENSNVFQWKYLESASQEFIVVPAGVNTYKLISRYSGMVVNVINSNVEGNVQMNSNTNQPGGMWTFVKTKSREGTGDGLKGEYYNGKSFNTLKLTRIDPQVLFNWGVSAPNPLLPVDNFSVRWSGFVEPRFTGLYTFYLNSDNGRRLWVNDQLIIDKWLSDFGVTYSGTIILKELTRATIKVEYFEETGGADIRLEWSSPLELLEVIPQSQLYSLQEVSAAPELNYPAIHPYPNPVQNILYLSGLDKSGKMEIFNSLGNKVLEDTGTSINTQMLSAGLYFLQLNLDGKIHSFKFIKGK